MSSNRQKGYRRERQAVEIYEAAGYAVEKSVSQRHGRTDWFGHFDMMAVRPDDLRLSQIKSNAALGIADINEWARKHAPAFVNFDMLVAHDREGWRLIELDPDGDTYSVTVDERELDCQMGENVTAYLSDQ